MHLEYSDFLHTDNCTDMSLLRQKQLSGSGDTRLAAAGPEADGCVEVVSFLLCFALLHGSLSKNNI